MKEKGEDEGLPFFFNRRKDFDLKAARHWQGIVCRLKQEAQARCQDSNLLPKNDSDDE